MTQQYTPNLGEHPDTSARRDAVHVAVAPVVAAARLKPGQHVGFMDDSLFPGKLVGVVKKCIGVVDPFLKGDVEAGTWFWIFLYPGTVTSLRHVWTHPEFVTKVPTVEEDT